MPKVVNSPRCPKCNKKQADWVEGQAKFTCSRCNTEFIIGDGFITFLTRPLESVMVGTKESI